MTHESTLEVLIASIPDHCHWLVRKRVNGSGFNAFVSEPTHDMSGFSDPMMYWHGMGDTPQIALAHALGCYNSGHYEHKEDTGGVTDTQDGAS